LNPATRQFPDIVLKFISEGIVTSFAACLPARTLQSLP
jgi:hypothetical protein